MLRQFIEYLKNQLGCIYVWGAQGETSITEAWIRKRETSENNAQRAIALWKKRVAEKRSYVAAFDCSGLIVHFLMNNGLLKSDASSRGLFEMCREIKSRAELMPGDFVFRHNGVKIHHVGVYIGDGQVIEAKGRDYGVVQQGIDQSGKGYWNRYGRFEPLSKDAEEQLKSEFPADYIYGGATYANLRKTADSKDDYNVIGKVGKGETVLVLKLENGWADAVKKTEKSYLRGFCYAAWLERK
ncbi:MAG: NlpC/P60 family protein [Clostridiaceae bacterium]|nr:C40 family peptidase [Eubacteriales bacterium]